MKKNNLKFSVIKEKNQFLIFPNPTKDFFNIYIKIANNITNENLIMIISDISGKEYHREKINQEQAGFYKNKTNISNYPPGIYFINITGNRFSDTKKLIVKQTKKEPLHSSS